MLRAIIRPILTGTAFPMNFATYLMLKLDFLTNLYLLGNVWSNAASLSEIALLCEGCPNLPAPNVVHCVVIVGLGESQRIRP